MSNTNDYGMEDTPRSHWDDTSQELLYGDPAAAAAKFQRSVNIGVQEGIKFERKSAEARRSAAAINRHVRENKHLDDDPDAKLGISTRVYRRMQDVLAGIGIAPEHLPTDPKMLEDWYLEARVDPRVEGKIPPFEQVLAEASNDYCDKHGIARRRSEDESRKRGIHARMELSAKARGMNVDDYIGMNTAERSPSYVEQSGSRPVTTTTLGELAMRESGEGGIDRADRQPAYSNAILKMQEARGQVPRGFGDGADVQVSRDANSRRYAR